MPDRATIETVELAIGLRAVLLTREQAGPPRPRTPEAPAAVPSPHRRSRRARQWGDDPDAEGIQRRARFIGGGES